MSENLPSFAMQYIARHNSMLRQALWSPGGVHPANQLCGRTIAPGSSVTATGSGGALAEDEEGPPGDVPRRNADTENSGQT